MFHCDGLVPGVDVSGHDSEDQERHGGRRLLQEMDNSSLEEIEGKGSKNCTAPGKDERKRTPECSPAHTPSSPPPPRPSSSFPRRMKEREQRWGNKWSPPHVLFFYPLCSLCFGFLMWGNPVCEVRWFPMSTGCSGHRSLSVTWRFHSHFSYLMLPPLSPFLLCGVCVCFFISSWFDLKVSLY